MLITCDNNIQMGYIYLMPKEMNDYSLENSDIRYYYDLNNLSIPVVKGSKIGQKLEVGLFTSTLIYPFKFKSSLRTHLN